MMLSRRATTGSYAFTQSGALPAYGGGSNGYGFDAPPAQAPCQASVGYTYDDTAYYKDKPLRSRRSSFFDVFTQPAGFVSLIAVLLFALSMHSRAQKAWLLREMQVQSFAEAMELLRELKKGHKDAISELDYHYNLNDRLEERDQAWSELVEIMENATKRESHRAVVDKYGLGPHHVEFKVQFPNSPDTGTFQVEMAPLKLMPHANHLFLEQVSHGLWTDSVFHVGHEHVLQAGPSTKAHRQKFTDYELDRLAFPEYSDDFPHVKWTLGFAGRPGGPSWYINKLNNEDDHGPYGQDHHVLDEFADPCFAKVVGGFDILEKIFKQKDNVKILSATITASDNRASDKSDAEWHKAHEEYGDSEDFVDFDDDFVDDINSHRGHDKGHHSEPHHKIEHKEHHVTPEDFGKHHNPSHHITHNLEGYYAAHGMQMGKDHHHQKHERSDERPHYGDSPLNKIFDKNNDGAQVKH